MANQHVQLTSPDGSNNLFPNTKGEDCKVTKEAIEVMGVTVGNLSDGDTIPANINLPDLLKLMFQTQVPPSYVAPLVSISNNSGTAAGTYETGTTISPKLRSVFTQNDGGGIVSHNLYKGATVIQEGGLTNQADFNVESFVLTDGTTTFKSSCSYSEGIIKDDNFGNPYPDGHIVAGTKNSSNYNYVGARKLFWGTGVGAIPTLNSNTIRGLTGGSKLGPTNGFVFNINVAVGQQYIVFGYPATLRECNQIMYVETNDPNMKGNFTYQEVLVSDARGETYNQVSYRVYSYKMAGPAAATMTFKVTI